MYAESLKTEYVIDLTSPAKDKNALYLRRGMACFFFQFQVCELYQLETKTASTELLMRTDVIRLVIKWISTATEEVQRF